MRRNEWEKEVKAHKPRPDPFRGDLEELYFGANAQLTEAHCLFQQDIHPDPQESLSLPHPMCVAFPNTVPSIVC